VVNSVGLEAHSHKLVLVHAMGRNVTGVIDSAVAAGILFTLVHVPC
jgi:oxaloacetate decarboxylase beta subunit